ncbi:MAG TPA: hypothetical protein ENN60_03275 [archaeon]|nr:hypothetical protein [archaeon]
MGFAEAVMKLSEFGFFQFFAPFALFFMVLYGVLLKYKPFGEWKDHPVVSMIYGLTSFLVALFIMLYGLNVYIENFLAWVLGRAGIVLILILAVVVISAFVKGGSDLGGKSE